MNPEEILYKLKVGESAYLSENNWNDTFRINWHVLRVPTGWIFIEDNPNGGQWQPINVFVPLTVYSNPNI